MCFLKYQSEHFSDSAPQFHKKYDVNLLLNFLSSKIVAT